MRSHSFPSSVPPDKKDHAAAATVASLNSVSIQIKQEDYPGRHGARAPEDNESPNVLLTTTPFVDRSVNDNFSHSPTKAFTRLKRTVECILMVPTFLGMGVALPRFHPSTTLHRAETMPLIGSRNIYIESLAGYHNAMNNPTTPVAVMHRQYP
ncbi:hypothetical protein TNIN_9591 [Trichonephila inaurata madagascariensis]|uniref:Uncharacterized protein n=1 Tax=Trichonephila inaurata madagascariensis TaxID=2747483 RepID=A0A8X6YFF7_9ARAC|nr:hypothetical protein TNIN_9591 [Trichonephila inaurata madagascariensis]